jgi:hypothetical protein
MNFQNDDLKGKEWTDRTLSLAAIFKSDQPIDAVQFPESILAAGEMIPEGSSDRCNRRRSSPALGRVLAERAVIR